MSTRSIKLPNGLVICASALLCAAVVALQNAELYAVRMEAPMQSLSVLVKELPDALRAAGVATGATALNNAEKEQIAAVSALLPAQTEADTAASVAEPSALAEACAEEDEAPAVSQAAEPPAEVVAPVAESVAPPVVESAEPPVPAEAEPAGDAAPCAEPPAAEALPPEAEAAAQPAPCYVPAPGCAWWDLLALRPHFAARRSHFPTLARPEPPAVSAPVETPPVPAEDSTEKPAEEPPSSAPLTPAPVVPDAVEASGLTEAPPMDYRIMMVGDSLMEDLGPCTHRALKHRKGLNFVVSAKFSTGLCRPDFFNWPAHMREVVTKRPPDLVVFFIGANDGLGVKEGKRLVPTGGQEWREAYGRKMDELVGLARDAGADVIWVELPAIGGRYNKLLHETQIAQREYCVSHGITSLRADDVLSSAWGKYEPFGLYKGKQVRLRRTDETHLTREGNLKVYEALKPIMERKMIAFYLAHPERHLSAEQVAKIKTVPAVYTCPYAPPKKKKETPAPQPQAEQP